jgi:CO dehydrogenase maturation factor
MTSKTAKVIVYLGKGGAGKTALSCLTARLLLKIESAKILLIDADPTLGLVFALGRETAKTVGEIRAALLKEVSAAKDERDRQRLANALDYRMLEALEEQEGYALLAMGRTEGPGCFCPVNALLRECIETLARHFDWVIIDAEAGIEQVSRQVVRRVDHPLIITDASVRGAVAAEAIRDALERTDSPPPTGVIVNRTASVELSSVEKLERAGLSVLGSIPIDENLASFDRQGRSLLQLPNESPALQALENVLIQASVV